jgi:hypothetical protein
LALARFGAENLGLGMSKNFRWIVENLWYVDAPFSIIEGITFLMKSNEDFHKSYVLDKPYFEDGA